MESREVIDLAQDWEKWRDFLIAVISLRVTLNFGGFPDYMRN
jgi:hypothetical protein